MLKSILRLSALCAFILTSSNVWAVDKANWMWELFHDRGETRVRDMVIPATHDSGTYNITSSSAVAPDAGDIWTQLGYSLGAGVVSRWSKTQTRNLSQQLEGGIRYLDFRIKKDSHGQFLFVHGLVGDTLPNMLQQVRDWAQAHPKELVFIGFEKLPDTTQQQDEMDQLVMQYLSHLTLPSNYTPATLTLNDVWSLGRNVVILGGGHLAAKDHWWDYGQNFHGVYGDSTNAGTIHAAVLNGRGGSQIGLNNQDLNKWHNISITTTPKAAEIASGVFDGLVQFFSGNYTPNDLGDLTDTIRYAVAEWVPDFIRQGKKVNFVSVDFFEDMAVVDVAIAMNWGDVNPPGGQLTIKPTSHYEYVWHDGGSGATEDASIWRPKLSSFDTYRALGHVSHRSHATPAFPSYVVDTANAPTKALVGPVGYSWVWHDRGSGADRDASVWAPIAPKGYTCLGHVGHHQHETPPSTDEVRCVHDSYLGDGHNNDRIWNDRSSGAYYDAGWWAVKPLNDLHRATNLFVANRSHWDKATPYPVKVLSNNVTRLPNVCLYNNANFDGANCHIYNRVDGLNYWDYVGGHYYSPSTSERQRGVCDHHNAGFDGANCEIYRIQPGVSYWNLWSNGRYTGRYYSVPTNISLDQFSLKNKENGRCLSVVGALQNMSPVDLRDCNYADNNQRWVDHADGMLRSAVNSNMCADILYGQLVDQAQLIMWPCHGQANQRWSYSAMSGHVTTLMNQAWAIKGHAGQDAIMRVIDPAFVDQTWTVVRH